MLGSVQQNEAADSERPRAGHLLVLATSSRQDLARSARAVGIRALGSVFGFLFNVVLARTLGRAGTGSVMFYLNFAAMTGLIATAGMDVVGLREFSRREGTTTQANFGEVLGNALLSALAFALGGFGFLLVSGASLAGFGGPLVCVIAATMLFLTALQKNFSDWLIAFQDFAASQITFYFINRVAAAILLVSAVFLSGASGPRPETCIAIYAAGLLLAALFGFWRIFAHFPPAGFFSRLAASTALFRDGMSCGIQNAAFVALSLSPFVLLGALSNTSELGLFAVSQRVVALMVLALTTVSQFAMRDFARASGRRDFGALAHSLTASARLSFAAAIAATIVLVAFAPFWVSVFGKAFAGAAPTLALLSVGICAQCLGMPFQAALLATNHERSARDVTIACAVAGIALNLVLIPRWGAEGAAIGTGIGLALQSLGHGARVLVLLPVHFDFARVRIVPRIVATGVS